MLLPFLVPKTSASRSRSALSFTGKLPISWVGSTRPSICWATCQASCGGCGSCPGATWRSVPCASAKACRIDGLSGLYSTLASSIEKPAHSLTNALKLSGISALSFFPISAYKFYLLFNSIMEETVLPVIMVSLLAEKKAGAVKVSIPQSYMFFEAIPLSSRRNRFAALRSI